MIIAAFTAFHVLLSLAGLAFGFAVVFGLLTHRTGPWNTPFLITTAATSVTGFFFPVHQFMPSHAIGILSLIALALAAFALYRAKLAGGWRRTYTVTAVIALYFNFFVLIVQSFRKVPPLHALAPTQSEPPFAIAQGIALLLFVLLGIGAVRSTRTL